MFLFKKFYALEPHLIEKDEPTYVKPYKIPNREEQFNKLEEEEFDIIIMGSGKNIIMILIKYLKRYLYH